MREVMRSVSHEQASQLLHNKFVVVLGDSIQRAVYKDLVLLLQKEKYLTSKQLKTKGEMTFEQDCLVEGGCLDMMHNGTEYREVRQFQSSHHLIRFYFVTRIFSRYMQSVLEDFRQGLKPDVVIVNSCVWDISRYNLRWLEDYQENLNRFFEELRLILPEETLVIWNLTMPLGERIRGGFLVPEIEHKVDDLRFDVIEANFYSGHLADAHGLDVLDLHFQFRLTLHHRTNDGVHWNAIAHRRITFLLLQHIAQAWGVILSCPLASVEYTDATNQQPASTNLTKAAERHPVVQVWTEFSSQSHSPGNNEHDGGFRCSLQPLQERRDWQSHEHYNYNDTTNQQPASTNLTKAAVEVEFSSHSHSPRHNAHDRFRYSPQPLRERRDWQSHEHNSLFQAVPYRAQRHQDVMRSRRSRHHYTPYTQHRPLHYNRYGHYY